MLCLIKVNSNTIEPYCAHFLFWHLRLTLCYFLIAFCLVRVLLYLEKQDFSFFEITKAKTVQSFRLTFSFLFVNMK